MTAWRKLEMHVALILLLALFVVAPLARPGFPVTGAGFQPVWALNVLTHCSQWPAALAGDMVRGDGLLPLLAARLFHLFGAESVDAIKWSLALAYLVGALALYGWLRKRWGAPAALLAAVVYTFLPYRLTVTYIAGGLSDAWAMALYPLSAWALWTYSRRETLSRGLLALGAWALLAFVNVGLAVWFAIVAGVALLAAGRHVKTLLPLLPAIPALVWGLLSAPLDGFADHHPYLFQLFSASWHHLPSGAGWIGEMPFQLGLAPLGLALLGVALIQRRAGAISRRLLISLAAGVLLTAILSLRVSSPFWAVTHLDRLLTYPWQMLGFTSLGLAILSGSALRQEPTLARWPWLSGLIVLTVVAVYGYLSPAWTELPPGDLPIAVYGENQAALIDYQFTGQVYPGAETRLDVVWQSLRPLDRDYTVFVQALDLADEIRGQQDIQPQGGDSPTSSWVPGQIITDTFTIQIDADGPEAGYQVIIGFYDGQTGQRLSVGGDDKVVLNVTGASRPQPWPCEEGGQ